MPYGQPHPPRCYLVTLRRVTAEDRSAQGPECDAVAGSSGVLGSVAVAGSAG